MMLPPVSTTTTTMKTMTPPASTTTTTTTKTMTTTTASIVQPPRRRRRAVSMVQPPPPPPLDGDSDSDQHMYYLLSNSFTSVVSSIVTQTNTMLRVYTRQPACRYTLGYCYDPDPQILTRAITWTHCVGPGITQVRYGSRSKYRLLHYCPTLISYGGKSIMSSSHLPFSYRMLVFSDSVSF